MTESSSSFRLTEGNSVLLDLIRGLSAQAVLVGHALFFYEIDGPKINGREFVMQNYAVLIFFILSGFLITYSVTGKLRRPEGYGFRAYFIDRFSRIYTAYLPALFLVLFLDLINRHYFPLEYPYDSGFSWQIFVGNVFMLQDFPGAQLLVDGPMTTFGSGQPFWTLSVEWWIYLFFGWLTLRILRNPRPRWSDLLFLLPLLIVPSFRLWGGQGNGLMMTWLLGALAYLVASGGWLRHLKRWHILLVGGWLGVIGLIRFAKTGLEYDPVLAFITTALILLLVRLCAATKWPNWLIRLIRLNAAYSYTLYLLHYSVLDLLRSAYGGEIAPWALFAIGIVASNLLSIAVGLYTETTLTKKIKAGLYRRFVPGA